MSPQDVPCLQRQIHDVLFTLIVFLQSVLHASVSRLLGTRLLIRNSYDWNHSTDYTNSQWTRNSANWWLLWFFLLFLDENSAHNKLYLMRNYQDLLSVPVFFENMKGKNLILHIFSVVLLNQIKGMRHVFCHFDTTWTQRWRNGISFALNLFIRIRHYGESFLVCRDARKIPSIVEMCVFVAYSRKWE